MIRREFRTDLFSSGTYIPYLLAFAFCLPLKIAFGNIVLLVFALHSAYQLLHGRSSLSFDREVFTSHWPVLLFFLTLLITLCYSRNLQAGVDQIVRLSYLFFVPLLFSFLVVNRSIRTQVQYAFVFGNGAAFIFNLLRAFVRSTHFSNEGLVFDASVSGGQPFWYSIVQGGNYFFYDEFSYFMHPTYAAMYFLFGIVITLEAVVSTKSRRLRTIYISVLIVFLLAIFLCSSRIVILCTALLVGGLFVKTVLARRSRRWILFGGAFLVLATFAITINPRFVGFQDSISLESFHHTRLEAWRSSIASLENHVFWGAGIGDERDALMASHLARGYTEGYEQRYNDHNEYFHIMNIGGVLAILSYLLVLGIPLGAAISNRDYVQFAFIMSFAVVCVVENLLVRRAGILYLIFFYCLFVPRARRVKSLTTPH
jgi:hypothetical protein